MNYNSDQILSEMHRTGIIPVFYHADIEKAKSVLTACYHGGVRVFEFTNRGENAFEVFTELQKHAQTLPGLILGIGTIMNIADTEMYLAADANFIVSPILKTEMAAVCARHDRMWIPGCGTLTEIVTAKEAGARLIKIFPGSVLRPKFVSSVLPVVPGLKLMPTGGVEPTQESLKSWFDAGVCCVGMGSQLLTKRIIDDGDWTTLQKNVTQLFSMKYR